MARKTVIMRVTGMVQGVGFRYTTKHLAYKMNISGIVKNLQDGSVEIQAIAEEEDLEKFIEAVKKRTLSSRANWGSLHLQRRTCRGT